MYIDEEDDEKGWVQGGGWVQQGVSITMTGDKWQDLRKNFERDWNQNEETTTGVGRFFNKILNCELTMGVVRDTCM